jgi:23S rRNA (uracil1939-C5)-methyltransferase
LHGSPEEGWRTRCRFHLAKSGDDWRLGLHQEGGRQVVEVENCGQLSGRSNQALRALQQALADSPGLARGVDEIELAESLDGSQLVACLDTRLSPGEASGLARLLAAVPWLSGLGALAGEGPRRRFLALGGDPRVTSTVAGLRLRSHVRSFFQANRFLVEDLLRAVVDATPSGGVVLDLYAGVGLFALPLAARAETALAAELNPTAVADAKANAETARLTNVRVCQGDVRAALTSWHPSPDERVVLDPPRTGAGGEVVAAVCQRKPAAVSYVSCDPPTLARDLAAFGRLGYLPTQVEAFDLFPGTFHLETLVQLRPA